MTGMERNSDVVLMASYAPLLANVNDMQWRPDLINFDSSSWYGLPGYYVQKMFSEHRGDVTLPVQVVAPKADPSLVGTKVEVEFLVDARGVPQHVKVVSATDRSFGASVREAVSHWKFEPAIRDGSPVPMKVELPVTVSESD